jgi:hypothetical protein
MEREPQLFMRNQQDFFIDDLNHLLHRFWRVPAAQSLQKDSQLTQDNLKFVVVNL